MKGKKTTAEIILWKCDANEWFMCFGNGNGWEWDARLIKLGGRKWKEKFKIRGDTSDNTYIQFASVLQATPTTTKVAKKKPKKSELMMSEYSDNQASNDLDENSIDYYTGSLIGWDLYICYWCCSPRIGSERGWAKQSWNHAYDRKFAISYGSNWTLQNIEMLYDTRYGVW